MVRPATDPVAPVRAGGKMIIARTLRGRDLRPLPAGDQRRPHCPSPAWSSRPGSVPAFT